MKGGDATTRARALGFVALIGLTACPTGPKAHDEQGPFLSILDAQGTTSGPGVTPASVSLALGGLPPEELPHLRERVAGAADIALRRAAPDLLDLGNRGPDAAAPDAPNQVGPDLPALTAAVNLLGSPWNAPGISVHLVPMCDEAAARCVPLASTSLAAAEDSRVRRGRALAWALTSAARIRVAPTSRAALLRSLREAQGRSEGTIALVFGAPRGTLDETELDALRREARRAMDSLAHDARQRPWLDALAGAQSGWALPIDLAADELLVVPRLGALARLRQFAQEVDRSGPIEWVSPSIGAP